MKKTRNRRIYEKWCNGQTYAELAIEYSISQPTVQHIIRREQMLDTDLYLMFEVAADKLGYATQTGIRAYCEFLRYHPGFTTISDFKVFIARQKWHNELDPYDIPCTKVIEETIDLVQKYYCNGRIKPRGKED